MRCLPAVANFSPNPAAVGKGLGLLTDYTNGVTVARGRASIEQPQDLGTGKQTCLLLV